MTKTTEIYKNLLQAASKWPSDKQRTLTVSKHITNRIKSSFESSSTPDLPFAQKELIALNALLNNELQQKYGPQKDSPMLQYLPPKKMYSLLDPEARKELDKKPGFIDMLSVFFGQK